MADDEEDSVVGDGGNKLGPGFGDDPMSDVLEARTGTLARTDIGIQTEIERDPGFLLARALEFQCRIFSDEVG